MCRWLLVDCCIVVQDVSHLHVQIQSQSCNFNNAYKPPTCSMETSQRGPLQAKTRLALQAKTVSGLFQIALKLLDCDFPDECVRGFATRVLEQLADERLEDILLQLTQVSASPALHGCSEGRGGKGGEGGAQAKLTSYHACMHACCTGAEV